MIPEFRPAKVRLITVLGEWPRCSLEIQPDADELDGPAVVDGLFAGNRARSVRLLLVTRSEGQIRSEVEIFSSVFPLAGAAPYPLYRPILIGAGHSLRAESDVEGPVGLRGRRLPIQGESRP